MKKYVFIFLIFVFMLLCGCSSWYGEYIVIQDNITYYQSSVQKKCFVSTYKWDGTESTMTVDIPNEVDGYRVTQLGGYIGRGVPMSFYIDFSDLNYESSSSLPDNVQLSVLEFTINIGKNIKRINRIADNGNMYYYSPDTETYYQVAYTVNCSEENKYFYSKNGKLYNKKDDTLVNKFYYFSDITLENAKKNEKSNLQYNSDIL